MFEGNPLEREKTKKEKYLEEENNKKEFGKRRFEEIRSEFERINKKTEAERTDEEKHLLKVYQANLDIFVTKDGMKENLNIPGQVNSICLWSRQRHHYNPEGKSSSELLGRQKLAGNSDMNINDGLTRNQVLQNFYRIKAELPSDMKLSRIELDKLKKGEKKSYATDISGMEIVFTRESNGIVEEAEGILIRFYDPEERAKQIE
ncbi:hypothetical protein KKA23_01410 [Patescibacteria group bacterium]|nr:hypothetical protein [Patescibacteria group bacterium]